MDYGQLSLLAEASNLAALGHRGQSRKDPTRSLPYVAHPNAVALLVQSAGFDAEVVAAALCHDLLEDTDMTFDGLAERLNPRVAGLVDWVSEQDKSASWEVRKAAYRRRLEEAPVEAVAIALADKVHNSHALVSAVEAAEDRDAVWAVFSRGPKPKYKAYSALYTLFAARSQQDTRLKPLLALLKSALERFEALLPADP